MGSGDFAAQYQQEPVSEGGNLIKWTWFGPMMSRRRGQRATKSSSSWDTAMSTQELSDFSAAVVLQVRKETVYVLDVLRARFEYPDLKRKIIETHKRWRPAADNYSLIIENKGSGMSLIQDLKQDGTSDRRQARQREDPAHECPHSPHRIGLCASSSAGPLA